MQSIPSNLYSNSPLYPTTFHNTNNASSIDTETVEDPPETFVKLIANDGTVFENISLKLLKSWGLLASAFTSPLLESTIGEMKINASPQVLSKLLAFFQTHLDLTKAEEEQPQAVANAQKATATLNQNIPLIEKAFATLEMQLLKQNPEDNKIIEEIHELYRLADCYKIILLPQLLRALVKKRSFLNAVNDYSIVELWKYLREEKIYPGSD